MSCLNSNPGSSDLKIFAEASDGLERVKVSCPFFARADLKCICSLYLTFTFHILYIFKLIFLCSKINKL